MKKSKNSCCAAGRISLCVGVLLLFCLFGSFRLLLTLTAVVLILIGLSCLLFRC